MDFSNLKNRITPWLDKTKPLVEKAKVFWVKTLDFTQKQAKNTPIFLKTEEEYNILMSAKRAILVAYDDRDILSQEITLRAPVWSAKAWMDTAEIRFFSISDHTEVARTLHIDTPIEMRVSYSWEEYLRTSDIATMKHWWDNRCYKKDEAPIQDDWKKAQTDPLA